MLITPVAFVLELSVVLIDHGFVTAHPGDAMLKRSVSVASESFAVTIYENGLPCVPDAFGVCVNTGTLFGVTTVTVIFADAFFVEAFACMTVKSAPIVPASPASGMPDGNVRFALAFEIAVKISVPFVVMEKFKAPPSSSVATTTTLNGVPTVALRFPGLIRIGASSNGRTVYSTFAPP